MKYQKFTAQTIVLQKDYNFITSVLKILTFWQIKIKYKYI